MRYGFPCEAGAVAEQAIQEVLHLVLLYLGVFVFH